MKGWLLTLLNMLVPLAKSTGQMLEDQDADEVGLDDLEGETLIFIGNAAQFLLDRKAGKNTAPPVAPDIFKASDA